MDICLIKGWSTYISIVSLLAKNMFDLYTGPPYIHRAALYPPGRLIHRTLRECTHFRFMY